MRQLAYLTGVAQTATKIGHDLVVNARPVDVREKSDRNTVTELDLKVEREIRNHLEHVTPEISFYGEEEGNRAGGESKEYMWTLDPIDGTSNFVHGVPLCAISLSLIHEGNAVVAAIALPFFDLKYGAAKGLGAFVNGRRLEASSTREISKSMISIGDYAVGKNATQKNMRRLKLTAMLADRAERIRMLGSAAIDLVWVAEGRLDGAVIMANNTWDTGAGVLIARESGAVVLDDEGVEHSANSTETIASNKYIASELVALVHQSRLPN